MNGIRANCVVPGPVYTPMVYARGMTEQMRDARRQGFRAPARGYRLGNRWRRALPAVRPARYIAGQVLVVDGGATLVGPSRASQWAGPVEARSRGATVKVIRPGFLDSELRRDLIELARDGSAAHRLARRANALVLLDNGHELSVDR